MKVRRIIKISIISFLALIVVSVIGLIALVTLVNPNKFKPMISKAIYEDTGRKLDIAGNISWKIWPNIGLKIEKISLSNPQGFTPTNMLEVSSATVSVEILPLLNHNLSVDSIIIDGLNIGLIKKGSLNNWIFNKVSPPGQGKEAATENAMQLELSKFVLTHISATYTDVEQHKKYQIKDFFFKLDTDYGGKLGINQNKQDITIKKVNFNFDDLLIGKLNLLAHNFNNLTYQGDLKIDKLSVNKLSARLNDPVGALAGTSLLNQVVLDTRFKGDLNSIILEGAKFNLSQVINGLLNIKVKNFSDPVYSGDIIMDEFSANTAMDKMNIAVSARKNNTLLNKVALHTKFDGNKNSINLQGLNINFPEALHGLINLKLVNFANPNYTGDINLQEFSPNLLLDKLNIAVDQRKNNQLLNKLALNAKFFGTKDNVNLQSVSFNFPGILQGLLNISLQNFSNLTYSGDVSLKEFSPNLVLDKMNMAVTERKNNQLLNKLALNTRFSGTKESINLQGLNFTFPGILQGLLNLKLQNFSKPVYSGDINLPTFSLNQVMAKLAMAPIDIPNKQLLDKVSLKTSFKGSPNSIDLPDLFGKFSGSTVNGTLNINSFKPLNLTENMHIDRLDVADVTDTNGFKVPLTGLTASGSLANTLPDFKSMSGVSANQNITVNNVAVLGVDLNYLFSQFDSALTNTGKAVTLENMQPITHSVKVVQAVQNMQDIAAKAKVKGPKDYNKKTNFGILQSNFVMKDGVANPSSFKLSGPTLKADGKGSVNMVDKSLNYNILAQIVAPMKNPILNKLTFPYATHGKFNNLEGGVDWESIQKQMIEYLITQTVSQSKAIVSDQVGKQLDNIKQANPQLQQQVDSIKQGAGDIINNILK